MSDSIGTDKRTDASERNYLERNESRFELIYSC